MSAPGRSVLVAAIAGSILAVSTAAVLIKSSTAPPLAIAFYRLLDATLLLLPFAVWKARRELARLTPTEWAGLLLVGAVLGLHFAAWISSLLLTSVASSVVLVTLHPAFVALVSARVFGEGLSPRGFLGVGAALVGGVLVTWGDARAGPDPLVGDVLALLGALAVAFYFLAGRGFRRKLGLLAYVTPVYAAATLTLFLLLVMLPEPFGGPLTGYAPREHAIFLALAVFPMLLGHTVLNWALKYVPAPTIATTVLGEPLGATLLAFLVLQESPPVMAVVGGTVALAGIVLVALSPSASVPRVRLPG